MFAAKAGVITLFLFFGTWTYTLTPKSYMRDKSPRGWSCSFPPLSLSLATWRVQAGLLLPSERRSCAATAAARVLVPSPWVFWKSRFLQFYFNYLWEDGRWLHPGAQLGSIKLLLIFLPILHTSHWQLAVSQTSPCFPLLRGMQTASMAAWLQELFSWSIHTPGPPCLLLASQAYHLVKVCSHSPPSRKKTKTL